jgi:hypothetical protein
MKNIAEMLRHRDRFEGARVHGLRKNAEQTKASCLMDTKREGPWLQPCHPGLSMIRALAPEEYFL